MKRTIRSRYSSQWLISFFLFLCYSPSSLLATGIFYGSYPLFIGGVPLSDFYTVMDVLTTGEPLPEKNRDHPLHGDYEGYRECYINPDWLLIWEIRDQELVLVLLNTGSHSNLFSKKYKK